jgi:hypothetical protein
MDAQRFEQLCRECDALLKEDGSPIPVVATPWLHVRNEHPSSLAQYRSLGTSLWPAAVKFLADLVGRRVLRAAAGHSDPLWFGRGVPRTPVDVIIVSHLIARRQLGSRSDFYYGDLPDQLAAAGHGVAIVMLNHTDFSAHQASMSTGEGNVARLFLKKTLSLRSEFTLAMHQVRQCFRVLRNSQHGVSREVRVAAAGQVLSRGTAVNLRLFCEVRALVEATNARTIVVTYEGHAWERIAFAAARSANARVRCIGYHHAILFPRQHAIARRLGAEYDPDAVLFAGEVARRRFALRTELDVAMEVVGAARHDRFVASLVEKLRDREAQVTCLVVPDGTPSECVLIISFAAMCARRMPDLRFIVRMHPVISFADVVSVERSLAPLPNNMSLSSDSIEADFARCRWVLYRGSGAGVRAAALGLRPFYLKAQGETMSIDPLAELKHWRKIISTSDEFEDTVRSDLAAVPDDLDREFGTVRDYLQSYFTPMNVGKFIAQIVP